MADISHPEGMQVGQGTVQKEAKQGDNHLFPDAELHKYQGIDAEGNSYEREYYTQSIDGSSPDWVKVLDTGQYQFGAIVGGDKVLAWAKESNMTHPQLREAAGIGENGPVRESVTVRIYPSREGKKSTILIISNGPEEDQTASETAAYFTRSLGERAKDVNLTHYYGVKAGQKQELFTGPLSEFNIKKDEQSDDKDDAEDLFPEAEMHKHKGTQLFNEPYDFIYYTQSLEDSSRGWVDLFSKVQDPDQVDIIGDPVECTGIVSSDGVIAWAAGNGARMNHPNLREATGIGQPGHAREEAVIIIDLPNEEDSANIKIIGMNKEDEKLAKATVDYFRRNAGEKANDVTCTYRSAPNGGYVAYEGPLSDFGKSTE